MRQNVLINSFLRYIIATIIGQSMTFLGIIVFTRLMSQVDYGQYSTYYAYVSLLAVIVGANLFLPLNNAYIENENEIEAFRKSVLCLSLIIMVLVMIVSVTVGVIISHRVSFLVTVCAIIHAYSFFLINYQTYASNMEFDYKTKQWLLIFPYLFQFLFALLLMTATNTFSFELRVVGSTIGVAFVALICFIKTVKLEGKFFETAYWKYALSISVPSIVMSLSSMLMQQCDKVMITKLCGSEDTAVYSVIYYLGYAILAVNQATSPVREAWIFRRISENKYGQAKSIQKWYLFIIAFLATGLLMVSPEIIKIIAPASYWKYEYVVPFVVASCMMILYGFYTEIILYFKKNMLLSVTVLLCAVLNIILNMKFIPMFGAVAACYTTVVSYFVLFILTGIIARKSIKDIYEIKYFIVFIAWIILISSVFFFAYGMIFYRYLIYILLLSILLMYFIIKRKEIRSFIGGTNL